MIANLDQGLQVVSKLNKNTLVGGVLNVALHQHGDLYFFK